MKFFKITLYTLLTFASVNCFSANTYALRGVASAGVNEIFENGGLILASEKDNAIYMYNTTPDIRGACNFFVEIHNDSPHRETFYVNNLVVTDQYGIRLPVRSKNNVMKNQASKNSTRKFFHELGCLVDTINAEENAGKVRYHEEVNHTSHTRVSTRERAGVGTRSAIDTRSKTSVHGEYRDESMRQLELRQMRRDHAQKRAAIEQQSAHAMNNANNYYIDNHTLMPGEVYGSNFQVIIPKERLNDLQYIHVYYQFAGEAHSFCYRVY